MLLMYCPLLQQQNSQTFSLLQTSTLYLHLYNHPRGLLFVSHLEPVLAVNQFQHLIIGVGLVFVYPINYMVAVVQPLGSTAVPFKVQCRNHYLGVNLEGNYASLIIHYIARLLLLLQTRQLNEFLAGELPKGLLQN